MNILLINYLEFGDLIFSTPLIRNLRISFDADIYCLVKKDSAEALRGNPYISKVFFREETRPIQIINELQIDLLIDFNNNLIDSAVFLVKGVKRIPIKSRWFNEWLAINLKIQKLSTQHYSERITSQINLPEFKADKLGLDYFIADEDEIETDWLPLEFRKDFILVCLHGKHNTRKLPLSKLIELCDRINKPIVLAGDQSDYETGNEIEKFFKRNHEDIYEDGLRKLNKKSIILNLCGKLSRNQTASLIKKSYLVFSYDSWIIPLASALKKEIYTIWGNTVPEFGRFPFGTKFTIFQNTKINCRPCSFEGFQKCPKGHLKCLNEINFDFYIPE